MIFMILDLTIFNSVSTEELSTKYTNLSSCSRAHVKL